MSVANLFVSADAVRIQSDTATYIAKQPVEWNCKTAILCDAPLALTVRGRHWIGVGFAEIAAARWKGFDDAVADALAHMEALPALADEAGGHTGDGYELTIAAWQDGPRAVRLIWTPTGGIQRYDLETGAHLAPSLGQQNIPANPSNDQLIAIAHIQQAVSVRHGLNMAIGGDIQVATVSADGARLETIGTYPDKAVMQKRMARYPAPSTDRREVA